jgi:type I restriction enzyme S subunit
MAGVEKLITEHIDVWTSAIKKRNATGRGSNKKIELTGIKKLRELILELAVRGKLVSQDPNDEPASVLLETIAEEKAQLIAEKKIKKQKPLPAITDEETPFELPSGWQWCRLGYFAEIKGGKRLPKGHTLSSTKTDHAYIRVTDMKNGSVNLNGLQYLSSDTQALISQYTISNKDLYITIAGTIGEIGSVPDELNGVNLTENAAKIVFGKIELLWLKQSLSSNFAMNQFMDKMNQLAQPKLALHRILSSVVALPPLTEQHRIVAKVDELMVLCDQLEQQTEQSLTAHQTLVEVLLASLISDTSTDTNNTEDFQTSWQRIAEHFDVLFTTEASIEQLKQTILQLAVMGKLVPQNPNDEPASVLLEKIAEEKEQLIANKKIKKQKPLPAITDEEKPFELPSSWDFSRIVGASLFTEYGTSQKAFEGTDGVPVLKMGDIQSGKVLHGGQKVVPTTIDDLPNLYLEYGDVLYNRTNSAELVGKTGMFEGESGSYTFASYLIRIRCHFQSITPQYLTLSMNTPLFRRTQIDPHVKQQCGQANVNGTLMKSMIVSVPPINEQHRIVAKVDELMALCEQLKTRLSDAQTTQLHLADAVIENALL